MIIVMRRTAKDNEIQQVVDKVAEIGLKTHLSRGEERTIIGVIGDERPIPPATFEIMEGVERVIPVLPPYRLASRDFKAENTVVHLNGASIGGKRIAVIAGPCSVEDPTQMREIGAMLKEEGVKLMRGGAFKPRTSPYSFQGLGEEGLELLAATGKEYGIGVVTEVMASEDVPIVAKYSSVLQIGTRNSQNYALLHAAGESHKPVLLKRGMSGTLEELLMSAEYIMSHGNYNVMLCERGIRTFETATRFTFDVNAIPALRALTHLPILGDPSHGTGRWDLVTPIARAAIAAGADGLLVEVHPHPSQALSDGSQQLTPENFRAMMADLKKIAAAVGREL